MTSTSFLLWGGLLSLLSVGSDLRASEALPPDRAVTRVAQTASNDSDSAESTVERSPGTVSLTIDYGDGFQKRYPTVPWREKMTVGDLLRVAQQHRRGIKLTIRGRGKMSLLAQIDDLKNQGGRGQNWVFRVNRKLSDRSFEVHELESGDTVLWKFDEYR